jgi:signal transduction histidine kinase
MEYNTSMQQKNDIVKLLRVAVVIWLVYFALSAVIDYTLKSIGPVERFCYLANFIIALFFLGITFWPWLQNRLGKVFLPLIICLMVALPVIANQIAVRFLFPKPLPTPESLLSHSVPFLLIALLLTAWQYKWQHILIFIITVTAANIVIILSAVPRNNPALSAAFLAVTAQAFTFLVVGFFIGVMVDWLRQQQRSLAEANLKLTHYTQTLEDLAVSKERSRIAQELHDTLSHTLSGLSVQLEAMKAYWDVDPATARKSLDISLTATRSGLEETRRVLMALRAKPLEELGLVSAIRQMAEAGAVHTDIKLDVVLPDTAPVLSPEVEQCLFRVAQEAITNVTQHAHAQLLTIRLEITESNIILTVQDDGTGFDNNKINDEKHFGLLGMKERVQVVNGKLEIKSQPGAGTRVKLILSRN